MSTHPEVLWAQRSSEAVSEKNVIYLTINLPDIDEKTLEYTLTATKLSFKARTKGGQTDYAFDLDLFAEVDEEKSTRRLTSRSLFAVLRKKELKSEYWTRLTKEKLKTPFIKTDFERWVDEDEQDGNPGPDDDPDVPGGFPGGLGSDFDLSKFSDNFGGDAGVGSNVSDPDAEGDTADAESNDEPPPLEDAEPAK